MAQFLCSTCKKQFKTAQHLNQHNNKKKQCVFIQEHNIVTNINILSNLSTADVINFIKTYNTIEELLDDRTKIWDYKSEIDRLHNENNKLKFQLDKIHEVIENVIV
jgi:uncharacterized coiled-coil DUF342 family protein